MLKIAISWSKINKSKFWKKTPWGIHPRVSHAKNQPPRSKTVAFSPANTHTDRQSKYMRTLSKSRKSFLSFYLLNMQSKKRERDKRL